jgi:drug/metabolite transporter (DMT)-like permease
VQALFGKWMLGEEVNAMRWIGIFLIIAGVYFVTRSVGPAKIH